jgi:N utilization substance protein B
VAVKSRRKAREAALRALYEIEVGGTFPGDAINEAAEFAQLDESLLTYLNELVWGVQREKENLDSQLSPLLHKYEVSRLASIDRNVLRLAAYEISFQPSIPPPVSINEAIELVKKFSTAESGKFVNGVLGRYLEISPKANWNAATAPPETFEEAHDEPEEEVEVETVEADSPAALEAQKLGAWRIRIDQPE